jgi:hypothetical protein
MNISFASVFQSVQGKPQTQTASVVTLKPKTTSPAGTIKDEYVPSRSDSLGTYKMPSPTKLSLPSNQSQGIFVSFGHKDSAAQPSFWTELLGTQKASSPIEELTNNPVKEMMEELDRLLEEAELRRRAEASDDSLTDGETLSATLDGEEELEVDTEGSDIGGMSKDEILQLIAKLFENMNATEAGEKGTGSQQILALEA